VTYPSSANLQRIASLSRAGSQAGSRVTHRSRMWRAMHRLARDPHAAAERGQLLARLLGLAEDAVYALAGLVLAAAALFALVASGLSLLPAIAAHTGGAEAVLSVLDQILLVLILVELFYTVRLSLREHELVVEPFVAVALIAAVRRILVLTAEEHRLIDGDPAAFQRLLLELGVLTGLIMALVFALVLLRRGRDRLSPG
jgi:uncharacterized membrane protein (DUF373 family)